MRICIIGQEEPVCFGPYLRGIIEARPEAVVLVVIAGSRGAGSHPKKLRQRFESLLTQWLIFEPAGFLRSLFITLYQKIIAMAGLVGTRFDTRSIAGAAQRHNIPVLRAEDLNRPETVAEIARFAPDIIINQSEQLLREPILRVPRLGVVNRHASLLPHFRGRLGSFWSHAHEPPEYGITIHFVAKELDAGPIILQKQYDLDPRLPYAEVLTILFKESLPLTLEALQLLENPAFSPQPNDFQGTRTYLFPTLQEAKAYRKMMKIRRGNA